MKFLYLLLLVSTTAICQENDDVTILWNENKLLSWNDFQATPKQNTDAAALTASGISFGFSIRKTGQKITDFTANVECMFYPNHSWYKPDLANTHILRHEQFHFNITELHARKFRKYISELKPSNFLKKQLNKLYETISKASYDMQKKYDAETDHSINDEAQAQWEIYISTELKKLDDFKTQ